MQNAQHKLLADLNQTGFGIKYENRLSAYTPPHWHQALELLLFEKGTVTCKFETHTFRARPGDMYLVNSHEVHETRCSRDAVYLCVHILPSHMCMYEPQFDQIRFSLVFDPADEARQAAYEQLKMHMRQVLILTKENETASKLECQARLFAIAALLVKYFSKPLSREETVLHRSDMTRLEPLLEYTQRNHAQDISLEDAAQILGLNKEYFCRLFKKNMGVTYIRYLYQVRTTALCRELETSEDTIGELAQRHGFRDPKMLNQYFREIYGCTPSEKRKFFREVIHENAED